MKNVWYLAWLQNIFVLVRGVGSSRYSRIGGCSDRDSRSSALEHSEKLLGILCSYCLHDVVNCGGMSESVGSGVMRKLGWFVWSLGEQRLGAYLGAER